MSFLVKTQSSFFFHSATLVARRSFTLRSSCIISGLLLGVRVPAALSFHSLFIQLINKPALYYLVPSDRVLVSVALLQPTQGPLQPGTDLSDGSGSRLSGSALHGETVTAVMLPFVLGYDLIKGGRLNCCVVAFSKWR